MRHGSLPLLERVDWTARNDTASKKFIHHSLACADLSVALMLAASSNFR